MTASRRGARSQPDQGETAIGLERLPLTRRIIRVALIGYGYWGPNLARCLLANPGIRLAAICETSTPRADAARIAYPRVPVLGEVDLVLSDADIDGVVIATTPATHGELALRALAHGKHVLVEKPFAGDGGSALALAAAERRNDQVLMVDHTYLYSPAFDVIDRLIAKRALGPLRYYQSARSNCFVPAHETDVLWDLAVHDLSLLDAWTAASPATIHAVGLRGFGNAPTPHAQLTLTYPGGALASIVVSWIAPAKQRCVVLGFERHTIVWDDLVAGSSVQLFNRGVAPVPDPSRRRQPQSIVEHVPVPSAEPLAKAVGHFVDCIASRTPPRSGASAGLRTVQLLEAADRSLAGGLAVVFGSPIPAPVPMRVA